MAGISVIEAANAEDEALAIALVLREALEHPGRSAALVTPDRALARRVAVTLGRWNVVADDSGGDPLADTPAGVFARLVAEAALDGLAPAPLLAVLKHPRAQFGATEARHAYAVAALERAVLRGPRPRPGLAGLVHAFSSFRAELGKLRSGEASAIHGADARAVLGEAALGAAQDLLVRLAAALVPLESVAAGPDRDLGELVSRHREAVALSSQDAAGQAAAFFEIDGEALDAAFDDIAAAFANIARRGGAFPVAPKDYAELFRIAIADRVVRRPGAPGSRIRIYGPLEARLVSLDRIVIGGLVEGVWPPAPRSDPWLSRPMRQALGLD
jgi:ATP-dependent helicase/nuclease subunit B